MTVWWLGILALIVLGVLAAAVVAVALAAAAAGRGRSEPARRPAGGSKLVPVVLGTLALLAVFFVLIVAAVLVFAWTANAPLDVTYVRVLGVAVLAVLSLPVAGLVFWLMGGGRKDAPAPRREPAGPGFRLVVAAWVIGAVVLVVLGVGYEISGLDGQWLGVKRHEWSEHLNITAPVMAGALIFWTVLRSVWVNRRRLASSVRFAYDTPARPDRPAPARAEPRRSSEPPPAPRSCPKCGAAIAAGAPEGLCPRCLIGDLLPEDPKHSPTTAYGPFVPPEVEEVAAFFPQLEVIRLIGQGGMGAVYLARQRALDRLVALKLINPREDDPTFAERFAREAKAMARLSHPNVVTVFESGVADGLPYLVMEYVDGVTLRDAMRAKKLTPAEALKIIPQVCDALEYAHSQGVVHRDVKPENILLDKAGRVKIADFGLAKLADPDGVSLTRTHQAMGTPHYMAPEQWERPGEVDHRADIYALGVLLYELLTGELPLGRFDPPSVKARVDARIDELILRALAKEPDRRYQHASDVKLALERFQAGAGWVQTPTFREYKSKATLLGWPLVHVVGGRDPVTGRPKVAKGWVAVGDTTAIGGVAVGGGAAFGGVAASGGLSVGVLALSGGAAVGGLALAGGVALAVVLAAAGGLAMSVGLAVAGGFASGTFAIGSSATGEYMLSSQHQDPNFGPKLWEWIAARWPF